MGQVAAAIDPWCLLSAKIVVRPLLFCIRTNNGRYSIADDRNDLINDYLRFVEAFLPKAVMLENVPGLKDDARFERFIATMADLGYRGEWKVLDVADYGVPQRRRRLIYVAAYKKSLCISEKKGAKCTVRDAIGEMPCAGQSGDFLHDLPEVRTEKIKEMIALIPKNGGSRSQLPAEYVLPCHKKIRVASVMSMAGCRGTNPPRL